MKEDVRQEREEQFLHDPVFLKVIKTRNTIAYTLTALILVCYFAFVILMAYNPVLLAQEMGNATLGIPLGIGVIIIACILTGIYVFWANKQYDNQLAELRQRLENADSPATEANQE